jgi:hypothetical protein
MPVIDLFKLLLSDGTSVGDRMRAFADSLFRYGQQGIFIMIDKETGNISISGHIPDDNAELSRILHTAADNLHPGSEEIKLPRTQ